MAMITQTQPPGTIGLRTIAALLNKFYPQYEEAAETEKKRYAGGLSNLKQVANLFGKSYVSGAERSALAGAEQGMVGSGLGGTTRPMATSATMRAGFEDVRKGRLAEALNAMAAYQGGWKSQFAPTPAELSHLTTGGFSGLLGQQNLDLEMLRLGEAMKQNQSGGATPYSYSFGGGGTPSFGDGGYSSPYFGGGYSSGGSLTSAMPSGPTTTSTKSTTTPMGSLAQSVFAKPTTGADLMTQIQNIDAAALGMQPREAMKQFGTYEEFASWAKGQGLNPGTKAEWVAVKKRIG